MEILEQANMCLGDLLSSRSPGMAICLEMLTSSELGTKSLIQVAYWVHMVLD